MACVNPIELIHNEYDVSLETGKELIALELTKIYIEKQQLYFMSDMVEAYKEILARLKEEE